MKVTPLLRHLLVATDGLESHDRLLPFAIALAQRHGAAITFCYVVDRARAIEECSSGDGAELTLALLDSLERAAEAIVTAAVVRAETAGISACSIVVEGRPSRAILACARDRVVDAIVVGTHATTEVERFMLGSTADGVLRLSEIPVFVVSPEPSDTAFAFERILVAVDDSEPSDAAVRFATELAKADRATLILCGVADTVVPLSKTRSFGDDYAAIVDDVHGAAAEVIAWQAQRVERCDVEVESLVVDGEAVATILAAATSERAGLIVIGTHGRRGLRRLVLGSVAEAVVRQSPVPVVVTRTTHDAAEGWTAKTTGALSVSGTRRLHLSI